MHNNGLTQQCTLGNREPVAATGVVCGLGLKTRRGDGCRDERVKALKRPQANLRENQLITKNTMFTLHKVEQTSPMTVCAAWRMQ